MSEEIEIIRGSGNIYKDFNRLDSDIRQTKVLLASEIVKVLNKRCLSNLQAEELTGIDQNEFTRIRKPDLKCFTIDRLITILNKLDQKVDMSFNVSSHSKEQDSIHKH